VRLVFLFFLLMNVIYFAWQYTQPAQTGQTIPVVDPGINKLLLVGEGSLEVQKRSPGPKTLRVEDEREIMVETKIETPVEPIVDSGTTPETVSDQCYAIGILSDVNDANALAEQLKRIGRPATIMEFEDVTSLYWVYLPSYESLEKANQVAEELKAKVKHLNNLGYEPEVEIKERKRTKYKVVYPVGSGKPLSDAEWRAIQAEYPDLGMREESCQ
jgi:hypothetical protein